MSMYFKAFESAYCINLDDDIDRYKDISSKYPDINRFRGIKRCNGRQGCAMSHTAVIRDAKRRDLKNVLILEDDIQVNVSRGKPFFDRVFGVLEDIDWSVLKLGYALEGDSTGHRISPDIIQADNTWGMHAYVVNSKYYDVFLTSQRQEEIDSIDTLTEAKRTRLSHDSFVHNNPAFKKTTFCCTPLLIIQANSYSTTAQKFIRRGLRQRRQFRKHIKRFKYIDKQQ